MRLSVADSSAVRAEGKARVLAMSSESDADGGEKDRSGALETAKGTTAPQTGAPPPCVPNCEKQSAVTPILLEPPSTSTAKDFRERTLRSIKAGLGKLWKRRSINITDYDPSYKVAYLGNVLTGWAKGWWNVFFSIVLFY
ncbi:hypothetical protein J437_LFUL009653 [Ladona fulva]|uniref:Uncharacterized protein n=1 Tax=Ladona fulva TaxID=123851 RepID=A0A8K0K9J6_LADFU|nr:hypothetical protein J437_LFUL009653 [Ladona fulva]